MARGYRYPYEEIAQELIGAIERGEYAPGARLPSEVDLRTRFGGVARDTVRNALTVLSQRGYTRTLPSRGVYVRSYERTPVPLSPAAGSREVAARVEVRIAAAPPTVAAMMPGEVALVARRSAGRAVTDTYYRDEVVARVPELGEPAPLMEPDTVMLERAGYVLARQRVRVTSRMPTGTEETMLALLPGTPVQEVVSATEDPDGRVILVRVGIYAGDAHYLEFALQA